MRIRLLLSLALTLAVQASHAVTSAEFEAPEKDAEAAIAKGDFSLRGVYGFVLWCQGSRLITKYCGTKVVPIKGTSDIIEVIPDPSNPKEEVFDPNSFNMRARRYAAAYNVYVLNALGCDVRMPMDRCRRRP